MAEADIPDEPDKPDESDKVRGTHFPDTKLRVHYYIIGTISFNHYVMIA